MALDGPNNVLQGHLDLLFHRGAVVLLPERIPMVLPVGSLQTSRIQHQTGETLPDHLPLHLFRLSVLVQRAQDILWGELRDRLLSLEVLVLMGG
jgi:hypothetical protein